MKITGWAAAALCVVTTGPAAAQSRVIEDAANALGGKERISAVRALTIEGAGANYNLGQNRTPAAALPEFGVTEFRRRIDFQNRLWRQEQLRTPRFLTGNTTPVRLTVGAVGDIGYTLLGDGTPVRQPASADRERRIGFYAHPLTILRLALRDGKVGATRRAGVQDAVDITTPQGEVLTLYVDRRTHLPTKVTGNVDQLNLGDAALTTTFADYEETGGLKLPRRLTTTLDRFTVADITVSRNVLDGDLGDLTAGAVANAPAPGTPPINVAVDEVAPGVWYLAGQSHHSIVVEFADHLTLIEAPQSEARTLAVIEKARTLRPGKPLTEVIVTHHHFDHAGGLRAAVSEGLSVITHADNRAWFQDLVARKHTVVPDELAKNPKPLRIRTLRNNYVLRDATRAIELHTLPGNAHNAGLLMVYFPAERLLVQADAYNPPPPTGAPAGAAFPFLDNLVENVDRLGLSVDRMMPIHGRLMPWSEVVQASRQ